MNRDQRTQSPHRGSGVTPNDSFDHKYHKNQSFRSTRNTFNAKTMSQFHTTHKHPKIPAWKDISNWKESATSMTRDRSPQHRFPQQKRFSSIQQDKAKSCGDKNRLNLRLPLEAGQSFTISRRPTHFPPQHSVDYPAPCAYGLKRWLEEDNSISYVCNTMRVGKNNPRQTYRKAYSSTVRGRTIGKEARDNSKYYLDHSRNHVNHHQDIVKDHPGVGRYTISTSPGKHRPAYTMGGLLVDHKQDFPAPNAYSINIPEKPSTNQETFDRGNRLDLSKPLNENPGPSQYRMARYLEGKKEKR